MLLPETCVKCLFERQKARSDDKNYLSDVRTILEQRKETDTSPNIVYQFNQTYKKYFGTLPDYEKEKKECNDLLLSLKQDIRRQIMQAKDPVESAIAFARTGNYLDYGALKTVDKDVFLELLSQENWNAKDHETYLSFMTECQKATEFLLLADNCGEIVLDGLFLEILKEHFPNLHVSVMVRGGRVLNDVTEEDARYAGIDRIAEVIPNGLPISGTVYHMLSEEARQVFDRADIILAKGQGNYESLAKQGRHVFYLFLCKCDYFAEQFQVPKLTGMFIEEKDDFIIAKNERLW